MSNCRVCANYGRTTPATVTLTVSGVPYEVCRAHVVEARAFDTFLRASARPVLAVEDGTKYEDEE